MSGCDISQLLAFGVFGTGGSDFTPNKTCSQVQNRFVQYCLTPDTARLSLTSTCTPELADNNASFVFTDALAGNLRTPHDLPIVYQSFPNIGDTTNVWVPDTTDVFSKTLDYDTFVYNGFRPVPKQIKVFAPDNASSTMIMIASVDNNVGQSFGLFVLDDTGILRRQYFSGSTTPVGPITAQDTDADCRVSPDGSQKVALIAHVLALPSAVSVSNPNARWVFTLAPFMRKLLVVTNTLCVGLSIDNFTLVFVDLTQFPNIPFQTVPFSVPFVFVCASSDQASIFVCARSSPIACLVSLFDIASRTVTRTWTVNGLAQGLLIGLQLPLASHVESLAGNVFLVRIAPTTTQPSWFVQLSAPPTATLNTSSANPVILAFIQSAGWITNTLPPSIVLSDLRVVVTPPDMPLLAAAVTPDGTRIWAFFADTLTVADLFASVTVTSVAAASNVFVEDQMVINDEYILNESLVVPGSELWYMGRLFATQPVPDLHTLVPGQSVLAVSRHMRYRAVFEGLIAPAPLHFGFAQVSLERINDFWLLTRNTTPQGLTNGTAPKFYETGDLVVNLDPANPSAVWTPDTNDEFSNPDLFQSWGDVSGILATNNGLYLLFSDTETTTVRVSYNVFNSAQFSFWCRKDPERMERALEAQRDFCFANFASADGKTFLDRRCSCIGDKRLRMNLFPTASTFEEVTAGRIDAVLPCILQDCGTAIANGPEESNVFLFVKSQCNQSITVCSDLLVVDSDVKLVNYKLTQNCGGLDIVACRSNSECPIGSVCKSGKCVVGCQIDSTCKNQLADPTALCNTNTAICEYGVRPESQASKNKARWQWIIIVILSVLAFIVFFIFLAVLTTPRRHATTSAKIVS